MQLCIAEKEENFKTEDQKKVKAGVEWKSRPLKGLFHFHSYDVKKLKGDTRHRQMPGRTT